MIIKTLRPEDRMMARAFVVLMAIASLAVLLVYYNMFKYTRSPSGIVKITNAAEENKTVNRNKASLLLEYTDRSVADSLASKVRVLCWILTPPSDLRRLENVQATWGKRCNMLLFFTTSGYHKTTKNKPKMIALPEVEGEENLGAKTLAAFRYLHRHHRREADWFLQADDTTYVIVENLRYMLAHHDSNSSTSFRFTHTSSNRGLMSGSVGYVLSRGALDRLVERGFSGHTLCRGCDLGQGVDMVKCLRRVGVTAGSSRSLRRGNFFPSRGQGGPLPNQNRRYWCWSYMYYPTGDGNSKYVISFHYIEPNDMLVLDFLIYHLHPYGIEDQTGKEPTIINSMKTTDAKPNLSDKKSSNANTDLSVKSKKAETDRSHTSKNVKTTKENTDHSHTPENVKTTKAKIDRSHTSKNVKTTKAKIDQSHTSKNVKTTKEKIDQSHTSKNVKTTREKIDQHHTSKNVKTTKAKIDRSHTSKNVKTTKAKIDQSHTSKNVKTTKEKIDQSHTSKNVKTTREKIDQHHTSKNVKTTKEKIDRSHTSKNIKTTREKTDQNHTSKHVKTTKENTDQSHTSKHVKTTKENTDQSHTSKHVKTTKENPDQSHTSKHVKTTKENTDQSHTSKHVKITKLNTDMMARPTQSNKHRV